jgi:urease accessory protein
MNTSSRNARLKLTKAALAAAVALSPALAQAHHLPGENNGFTAGFSHPFLGWDHMLAMIAVGLWAAQLGGRARWAVPASFVSVMALGGILGMAGAPLPGVEAGIMASVLVLGLLTAMMARLPLAAAMTLVGVFALCHGHAHGTEIPAAASGMLYGTGFICATAALHGVGIGIATLAGKRMSLPLVRIAGAAICVAGVCLWLF